MKEKSSSVSALEVHLNEDYLPDNRHISKNLERMSLLLPQVRTRICFCIPVEWVVLPEDGHEIQIQNSNVSTLFLLLNTMIGSGIVVQAYVFSQSGITAAIIEYIVIGIMIYLGADMLINVGAATEIYDYSQLTESVLGKYGKFLIDISIVINNAGALLSYILIIGTLFEDIVHTFSSCSAWYCNIGFLTILPIVCFTIPLCLIRNFGHLAIISYISIGVITSIIFLVLIGGPIHHEYHSNDDTQIMSGSFTGSIRNVGDIIFALGYITAVFHAYTAMQNKSIENFRTVAKVTTASGVGMCFFTGLAGYLSFRDNTETNILLNFTGTVGVIFKLAMIIHLILYIPGDFVIMRHSLWTLFQVDDHHQDNTMFISTTLFTISMITMIAILLQLYCANSNALGLVIDITGGIAGSILYFIIPGLLGRKLYIQNNNELYWKSVVLLIFGIWVVILVLISNEI
jgi:amino acid permease